MILTDDTKLEANLSRGNNTPRRSRCAKKIKKKKKGTKGNEDKNEAYENNDLEDDQKEYIHQISLFAKKRSKEEVEDTSSYSSNKEEYLDRTLNRPTYLEITKPGSKNYNFSRSAESKSNKHLSLLSSNKLQSLFDPANDQQTKKRASTSSSSSDEIFERDTDSKYPTLWSSKAAQNSHNSSNELNHGPNQNLY